MAISSTWCSAGTVLLTTVGLVACGVSVHRDQQGDRADIDIQTPVGALSVHTDAEPPDTGLPVYPGARPTRGPDGRFENADVRIGSPLFGGVTVVAATFEHDDAPEAVLGFYQDKMRAYGEVTECRGNVDFKRRSSARRPVCTERASAREVQLVTGTEERHRMVVVKPHGSGSTFSVVYVQTDTQG